MKIWMAFFLALLAGGARAGMSPLEAESDEVLIGHYPVVAHLRVLEITDTNACTKGRPPQLKMTVVQSLKGTLPKELRAVWQPPPHDIDWGVVESNRLFIQWSKQPYPPPEPESEWLVIGAFEQDVLQLAPRCRFVFSPERLAYLSDVLSAPEAERRDAGKLFERARLTKRLADFRDIVRGREFNTDIFQLDMAMRNFVEHHRGQPGTLDFLRQRACDAEAHAELPACLGLAKLGVRDEAVALLKTWQTAGQDAPLARAARNAIAFLPTDLARKIAEDVVLQQPQKDFALLGEHLRLLRAIGDDVTVKKLAGATLPAASYTGIGRDAVIAGIQHRLALDAATQARWQEQELALHQICLRLPNYCAPAMDFHWAAEHLVAHGVRYEVDFLRYKLEQALLVDARQRDWEAGVAAPICLLLAGRHQPRELQPVVENWAKRQGEVQRISQGVLAAWVRPAGEAQP